MSRSYKKNDKYRPKEERRFRVRADRRNPPDVQRLGRALIALAMAENEAKAQQQGRKGKFPEGGK